MRNTIKVTHLTVMGMEGRLLDSLSWSLAPLLITTYRFFSFSAAAADSRGPHLLPNTRRHQRFTVAGRGRRNLLRQQGCRERSRSGVGDVLLERGQRDLALHALRLRLGAQVDVHDMASQSLQSKSERD